jgi:TonB family protein
MPPDDPDVHLQRLGPQQNLDLPWYRSLYQNLRELIHPPRLPPLEVTSQPVVVKDIWGLYGRQKKSFLLSTGFQAALVAVIALVGLSHSRVPARVLDVIQHVYFDPTPADPPKIAPSQQPGGGGGGDGSLLPASPGKLAKAAPRQFTAPQAVPANLNPILTVEPSIVTNAVYTYDPSAKPFGDPWAADGPLSNGRGHGNGIGDGCCGGQGNGDGNGAGPGQGGPGFTNPVYTAGKSGLINPVALFKPEPDYSEDARKAKLQGTVLLEVVVDQNGRPQIRKVLQSLGLGLDEQAIKTVSTWRFKPGRMDGKAVPVVINVYVSFRLL